MCIILQGKQEVLHMSWNKQGPIFSGGKCVLGDGLQSFKAVNKTQDVWNYGMHSAQEGQGVIRKTTLTFILSVNAEEFNPDAPWTENTEQF